MAKLNDLTGKEFILFTRTWFQVKAKTRNKEEIKHPAKYPEEMCDEFIKFFTHKGDLVFDPFLGVGSTIVSAERNERKGCGIELSNEFYEVCKKRCSDDAVILNGDSRKLIKNLKNESMDYILTSPPYWNILRKKRGNSDSQHSDRAKRGLKLIYSDDSNDLGNITDYEEFVNQLSKLFCDCYSKLKKGKYMTIVIQNFRNDDGEYMTLAWDLAKALSKKWKFCGEKIWIQDDKKLGIWGYPSSFVPNIHHHYCLIFRKDERK